MSTVHCPMCDCAFDSGKSACPQCGCPKEFILQHFKNTMPTIQNGKKDRSLQAKEAITDISPSREIHQKNSSKSTSGGYKAKANQIKGRTSRAGRERNNRYWR